MTREEAMSLAERVIVMDQGRIKQEGTPTEIYTHPANKFVAEFIGRSNWFSGRLEAEVAPEVHRFARPDGPELLVPAPADPSAASYEVCVRPERITVATATDSTGVEADGPMNVLHGVVADSAFLGADLHMFIELSHGHRIAVIKKNLGERVESSGGAGDAAFRPRRLHSRSRRGLIRLGRISAHRSILPHCSAQVGSPPERRATISPSVLFTQSLAARDTVTFATDWPRDRWSAVQCTSRGR